MMGTLIDANNLTWFGEINSMQVAVNMKLNIGYRTSLFTQECCKNPSSED